MSNPALVLLCEDSREDSFLLRHAFSKAGLSQMIVDVRNGRQAINYLSGGTFFGDRREHPLPALVLLDLRMPLMDGFEVLAWLQTRPELKTVPVVVLAASNLPVDIRKAKELGAQDYFVKPQAWPDLIKLAQSLHDRWIKKPVVPCDPSRSRAVPRSTLEGPRSTT